LSLSTLNIYFIKGLKELFKKWNSKSPWDFEKWTFLECPIFIFPKKSWKSLFCDWKKF